MQRVGTMGSSEARAVVTRDEALMLLPALDSEIGTYKEMLNDVTIGERTRHRMLIEQYLEKLQKLYSECGRFVEETATPTTYPKGHLGNE